MSFERPDSLDTTDIAGATTKRLHSRTTPHPFNTNDDIQFSRPISRSTHATSQRCTDPLNPAYRLPSSTAVPVPAPSTAARDVLWTLPQPNWKPDTRTMVPLTDAEKYGRQHLFRKEVASRQSMVSADITGPQFRCESPMTRHTDPLRPTYIYDGGQIEEVNPKRPHYGSMFTRSPAENFSMRTDDILTEAVFTREYPKELIKTRVANRTDDILGAQANTWCAYPRLWKHKDPAQTVEKTTNRVIDIDGAVASTAGQGPPLYRRRHQAVEAAKHAPAPRSAAASASRAADIASVQALP